MSKRTKKTVVKKRPIVIKSIAELVWGLTECHSYGFNLDEQSFKEDLKKFGELMSRARQGLENENT